MNQQSHGRSYRTRQPPGVLQALFYPRHICLLALHPCISRPSMSGILSSVLFEPVIRQARRFSHQIDPPSPPETHRAELPPTIQGASRLPGRNGRKDVPAMSGEEYSRLGQPHTATGGLSSLIREGDCDSLPGRDSMPGHADSLSQVPGQYTTSSARQTNSDFRHPPTPPMTSRDDRPMLDSQGPEHAFGNAFEMDEIDRHFTLPEDDGMGVLRKRIHAIRNLGISNAEKAHMIHRLMTARYNASCQGYDHQRFPIESLPPHLRSSEQPAVSPEGNEHAATQPSVTTSAIDNGQPDATYSLTEQDLQPTFCPRVEADASPGDDRDDIETEEFDEVCLGCEHYKRNVKLQCYDCKKWYTCRFCHDGAEDHHLNRRKTQNMLCMLCGQSQPAGQWCRECDQQAAQYFCSVCKLWDNDSKKNIYHCNDCGICRVGQGLGKDFFHCKVSTINCDPYAYAKIELDM